MKPTVFPGIRRFVAIEIALNQQGQNQFPDQSQLRGALIDSIVVLPGIVAAKSAVTASSVIATDADLANSTVTLQYKSDAVQQNLPLFCINPFQDPSGSTPFVQMRELWANQPIDWNQCFIRLNAAPSTAGAIVSLGVYYYWPDNVQP